MDMNKRNNYTDSGEIVIATLSYYRGNCIFVATILISSTERNTMFLNVCMYTILLCINVKICTGFSYEDPGISTDRQFNLSIHERIKNSLPSLPLIVCCVCTMYSKDNGICPHQRMFASTNIKCTILLKYVCQVLLMITYSAPISSLPGSLRCSRPILPGLRGRNRKFSADLVVALPEMESSFKLLSNRNV